MATVLLGWCLGSGLGHIRKLLPLAQGLHRAGHRCVIAAHSFETIYPFVRSTLEAGDITFVAAPIPQSMLTRRGKYVTFADTLWACGFSHPDRLTGEVAAWDGILDLVRPDLVVNESAPVLALACHDRIPTVFVGTGYALPPAKGHAFPAMRPGDEGGLPVGEVMQVVAETQRRRGRPAPPSVPALFEGDRIVASLPELDPYRRIRPASERGLAFEPLVPVAPDTARDGRIFAYLHGEFRGIGDCLAALGRTGATVETYVARSDGPLREAARRHGIELHDRPQPFSDVLGRCTLVVHHGGAGTCEAALAAGRYQLVIPRHGEGHKNAESLAEAGVAQSVASPAALTKACARALAELPTLDRRVRAVAHRIHDRRDPTGLDVALERCRTRLADAD